MQRRNPGQCAVYQDGMLAACIGVSGNAKQRRLARRRLCAVGYTVGLWEGSGLLTPTAYRRRKMQ